MEKKKRIFYNLIVGIGGKVLLMVLGFLVPKLYIENYGSEMNGLLSSIAQVFTYLALLEAGVGTATTQALYEPVSKNDFDGINAIMSAASKFYKRTGILYGIGVIGFAIVYPLIVKNSIDNWVIFGVILLSGANGVLQYFFQSKYFSLLNAEGKAYVHVAIGTIVSFVTTISKLVLLVFRFNIIFVYTMYFVIGMVQILALNIYIKTRYKYLNCRTEANYQAISQNKSVLIHQVSSLIFSNTDVLILTAFCDLKTVSIYTIYSMVTESINTVLNIVFGSFTAALGLTYQEDKERFKMYYDLFELGTWTISFIIMTVTLLLYNPFIGIYTANADIVYVDKWLPLLFVLGKLLSLIRMPGVYAVNVAGHFKATQTRTIIESSINIIVSLICVQKYGIYGVLFGTLAALLYRTVDFIVYANTKIVRRRWSVIIRRLSVDVLVSFFVVVFLKSLVEDIDTVGAFIKAGIICTLFSAVCICIVNGIVERKNQCLTVLKYQLLRFGRK